MINIQTFIIEQYSYTFFKRIFQNNFTPEMHILLSKVNSPYSSNFQSRDHLSLITAIVAVILPPCVDDVLKVMT